MSVFDPYWLPDGANEEFEEWDDGPSVEELSRDQRRGLTCAECGCEFVKAHGSLTACAHCWSRLTVEEMRVIGKAVHEEANRAAHIKQARKRKATKQRREQSK